MEAENTVNIEVNTVNIEVFKGLVSTAPAILEQNKDSVGKAESYGNQLIAEVQSLKAAENGTPNFELRKVLDVKIESYLKRVNETTKLIKERRTPITGLFDDFKKMFTALENKIDSKTPTTFPGQLQLIRNQFATDEARERQRVQAEQEKARNYESEKIRVKSEIDLQLKKHFLAFAEKEQQELIKSFENLQLIAFDFEAEKIKNYAPDYPRFHFDTFKPNVQFTYIDVQTADSILNAVKNELFPICQADFKTTMLESKRIKVEQLESKRAELQEIANALEAQRKAEEAAKKLTDEVAIFEAKKKADEAEAQRIRLEKEAEQRKSDEAAILKEQSALKEQTAVVQAATVQQVANTNLLFEMETAQVQPTANVKEGIEIVVKNATGWLQIVAFYFEKEGLKKLPDELGKIKLEQMKTWCEKHTMKTGETIQSIALEYKDVYKAVNKK